MRIFFSLNGAKQSEKHKSTKDLCLIGKVQNKRFRASTGKCENIVKSFFIKREKKIKFSRLNEVKMWWKTESFKERSCHAVQKKKQNWAKKIELVRPENFFVQGRKFKEKKRMRTIFCCCWEMFIGELLSTFYADRQHMAHTQKSPWFVFIFFRNSCFVETAILFFCFEYDRAAR